MFKYRYNRIDLVGKTTCYFCRRPLSAGKAYILNPESSGIDVISGPTCAVKNAGKAPPKLPDYTKAERHALSSATPQPSTDTSNSYTTAFEYLTYRMQKLTDFDDVFFVELKPVWKRVNNGLFDNHDEVYVERLMNKADKSMPLLTLSNLNTCYLFAFWLKQYLLVDNSPSVSFIQSLYGKLQDNLYLTQKQITSINTIFEKKEGFPELNISAFTEAVKADAKQRPWKFEKS
jgi:hypothetical protein